MKHINDRFEARGNSECQKVGLTLSQFRILVFLLMNEGRTVTQREMETEFKVSHPTICGILKRMEEKEFLTTEIVKEGKQQKYVYITEKGRAALKSMEASRNEDDAALLSLFTEQELAQFEDYLLRVLNCNTK